jgi:hypothetical protein
MGNARRVLATSKLSIFNRASPFEHPDVASVPQQAREERAAIGGEPEAQARRDRCVRHSIVLEPPQYSRWLSFAKTGAALLSGHHCDRLRSWTSRSHGWRSEVPCVRAHVSCRRRAPRSRRKSRQAARRS